ncbi:MAG: TIGR03087 family PEP-CTERM/XrtA system glycosyltransferase [bacterium]|nr:TIGR03087 family PEP-CTERM/XrtA system glycosyltransferase [bacterium]
MNVLYLAHRIPYPPNKGDKLRSFHQIKELSAHHRIWCAAFADDPGDLVYAGVLHRWCQDVCVLPLNRTRAALRGLVNLLRGGTTTEGFYRDPGMSAQLRRWCAEIRFDVLVVFSSGVANYAKDLPVPVKVLDFCDLDSRKWWSYAQRKRFPQGLLYRLEARRLARRELEWIEAFDHAALITETEKADLTPDAARKTTVVGNGVLMPGESDTAVPASRIVGFVGAMDYAPNVDAVTWFVEQVWPRVQTAHPAARFQIVGRNPTARVRRLAKVQGVDVVGEVTHVIEAMKSWQVSVAPMHMGRGIQNKVLEAMAAARPVVLTPLAAAGLSSSDVEHLVLAETPEEFATEVNRLLADVNTCQHLGAASRHVVAREHSWAREVAKLEGLFAPGEPRLRLAANYEIATP